MPKVSNVVREAIERMRLAPPFFTADEWKALASYDGPVVSGDPDGRLPENLEDNDNE